MVNILYKELKLSTSILTYFFILFSFMYLIPGYPILCGVFFICLGIFKSFENYLVTNDILFSALLPISKKDVVKAKFIFVCFIEVVSFILMSLLSILRNTILVNSSTYLNNFMMNANGFALMMSLLLFALFNLIFISGYFETTYKQTKPFIYFMIVNFIVITVAESLHHFPNLSFLNSFGNDNILIQLSLVLMGILIYILITYLAYRKSWQRFSKIDL